MWLIRTASIFLLLILTLPLMYSSAVLPGVPDPSGSVTLWITSDVSEYPLIIEEPGSSIALRPGVEHNITIYAQGYRQTGLALYTPSPGDTLTFTFDPAPLLIIDVFGRRVADLAGGFVSLRGEEGEIQTVTALDGKAYVYGIYDVGEEVDVFVNPPFPEELWRDLIQAGSYEPSLRNVYERFTGVESRSPLFPYNPGYELEADSASHTMTADSIQTRNIYLARSPSLAGYVKTESGDVLPGAIVAIRPDGFNRFLFAVADEDGRYEFQQFVKPGLNRYSIIYKGFVIATESLYISIDRDNYNLTIPDFYEFTGYVVDLNGRPIPNVWIGISSTNFMSSTYSGDDGSFTMVVPKGLGTYMFSLRLSDVLFRNVFIDEADIADGSENITLQAEMIVLSGSVVDTDGFVGTPILRLKGFIPSLNKIYRVDIALPSNGRFEAYVPWNISIGGVFYEVSWSLEMADYYYAGSLSTPSNVYTMDHDFGVVTISPMPTIDIGLNLVFNGDPPAKPIVQYLFSGWYNETSFNILIETNASIYGYGIGVFTVDGGEGVFTMEFSTPPTMQAPVRITLPKNIISTSIALTINGDPAAYSIVFENATHYTIEFTVSGKAFVEIRSSEVIPEFNSLVLLLAVPIVLVILVRRIRIHVERI